MQGESGLQIGLKCLVWLKPISMSMGGGNTQAPKLLERRRNGSPHQSAIHQLFNKEPMGN